MPKPPWKRRTLRPFNWVQTSSTRYTPMFAQLPLCTRPTHSIAPIFPRHHVWNQAVISDRRTVWYRIRCSNHKQEGTEDFRIYFSWSHVRTVSHRTRSRSLRVSFRSSFTTPITLVSPTPNSAGRIAILQLSTGGRVLLNRTLSTWRGDY
jgi:hypothetical protein